ncbi:hypothetical protein T484DRAFT_1666447 [Baffinella frigidus]|nr:hypothetical protein T484DRAFT_1666447 [Cryptophyta sp. CCMP2293]
MPPGEPEIPRAALGVVFVVEQGGRRSLYSGSVRRARLGFAFHDLVFAVQCPDPCPAGTYSSSCTSCPAGKYSAAVGASSSSACTSCEVGAYNSAMGVGQCTPCPAGTSSASGSDELTDCMCVAGFNGTSDGAACTACEPGSFKSGNGTGQCSTCPSNHPESAGGSALCQCSAGFTGADGGTCAACVVGEYKAAAGPGSCTACPSHASSASGSNYLTDCKCVAGYTAASDGVSCSACNAATYKVATGTGPCSTCPAGTSSASGSDDLTDCNCLAGYHGTRDGSECTACLAGEFKSEVGTGDCPFCPANSESSAGSALCYCSAGFTGADGGPCVVCSDCASAVTFIATLAMTLTEFTIAKRNEYVAGVAQALSVSSSSVAVASVTQQFSRRRLLASTILVSTTVTVARAPFSAPHCTPRLATSPLSSSAGKSWLLIQESLTAAGLQGQGDVRGFGCYVREPQPRACVLGHLSRRGAVRPTLRP